MRANQITAIAGGVFLAAMSGAQAQDKEITLCWAAWDPANALVELSKDFTASTGIGMNFEFVPWKNFADRFLNELNLGGKLCDLMIASNRLLFTLLTIRLKQWPWPIGSA